MPYRRLPNTDAARIRALKIALEKTEDLSMDEMAFPFTLKQRIEVFLPKFESATSTSKNAKHRQCENSPKSNELARKARLYLSHFIQVMNMCIIRGEMKPEVRKYYGLDIKSTKIPNIATEPALLEWGKKIIEGDSKRLADCAGNPIYCPTIAVVRTHFENFKNTYSFQRTLQQNSARYSSEVAQIRADADALIVILWDAIENHFSTVTDLTARRVLCEDFGISYVFRRGEREKIRRREEADRITLKLF